jgi:hypothetical protein
MGNQWCWNDFHKKPKNFKVYKHNGLVLYSYDVFIYNCSGIIIDTININHPIILNNEISIIDNDYLTILLKLNFNIVCQNITVFKFKRDGKPFEFVYVIKLYKQDELKNYLEFKIIRERTNKLQNIIVNL